ncbi:MAG: MarR family winged helix-turn-helix transcriptional regulator [Acidimicrobiales bacterium]
MSDGVTVNVPTGSDAPDAQPPSWLDAEEQRAWRSFLDMESQLSRVLGRELQRQTGLSNADYAVLVHLSEAPAGRMRPFELGDAAGFEKSRLSHQLTRMERRGLVERQLCPSDSRGSFVALTAAGRAAIEVAAPFHVAQVRRWFLSPLTTAQLGALTSISAVLLAHLGPSETGPAECGSAEAGSDGCGAADEGEWPEEVADCPGG